jgi:hypothetical protein
MTKLELPKTIRTARVDELPVIKDNLEWIEESKSAKIVEGFVLKPNDTGELPFDFFCEINVDNPKLWKLFKDFLVTFPDEISFIFNQIDSEPIYTKYDDKFKILNEIEKFETELTQDGFLEWGIIYHDENILKEVFIKKPKYVQFWGVDKDEFLKIMEQNSINEIEEIKFIDEYPLVTEALRLHNSETTETSELINHFKNIFIYKSYS